MIAGVSSVALVVRLKSTDRPSASACWLAYSTTRSSSGKFISVSPPKNVMCTPRRSPDSANSMSIAARAVSKSMNFGLPSRRRHLVRAVLVAVPAGKVALIRQVQHQRLQRENRRRILRRLGGRVARNDGAALRQLAKQADCILCVQAECRRGRSTSSSSESVAPARRSNTVAAATIQFEDRAGRDNVERSGSRPPENS